MIRQTLCPGVGLSAFARPFGFAIIAAVRQDIHISGCRKFPSHLREPNPLSGH